MNNLWITVDVAPGADILATCRDMIILARQLGVTITGKFNDVDLMASPAGNADVLADNWRTEMDSKREHKIASSTISRKRDIGAPDKAAPSPKKAP